MSNLRLVFDAVLNFVWDMCVQRWRLCLPVRLIRMIPVLSFHLSVRKNPRSETTYQIALPCLTLQSHRWALFRPPRSSKQISEPDKSTVLFFPVTNPSSKRRAESLHQPLVMAMKWTGACAGATAAAPSQHANVAPWKPAQRRPNKTALKLIWWSYSCLLLDIMLM